MPGQPAAKKAATAPVGKAKPTAKKAGAQAAKKKAKASPKKKMKTDDDDEDGEDEEDYDYDAEDYDYDAEEEAEEEDEEEGEEDGEDEEEEEDEGEQEKETKEKTSPKKAGLAKMQEEIAARFEAIDSRITVFMKQFPSLLELHESYNNAQKSGGWCCKSDLKALKEKVEQPAKEPLALTTLSQSVARLEKQMKEQLVAQERRPSAHSAMEQSFDGAVGAHKPTAAPSGVKSPTAAVQNEELMTHLQLFIKTSVTRHEQLEAQVQRIEMQFTGTNNCLACGTYSPPSTAIGDRSLDQKPGSRRNRVGAPVAQFMTREWEHDKFDPARPSLKKGGGFNTTASSFFGDSFRNQMSPSQSSPTVLSGSRRKRAGYTTADGDTSKLDGE